MKTLEYVTGKPLIGNDAKLGIVYLKVNNLEEQVKFYHKALKMTIINQTDTSALLGDSNLKPLLHLKKVDHLKRYHATSGMYHFALLYPNEKEFAKAVAWLMSIQYPNHPTDHGFSKTTYLKDPEGNDIELYIRTINRAQYVIINNEHKVRYTNGNITDGRDHLDLQELFSHLSNQEKIDSPIKDMEMGHIHLYGYNLFDMQKFYTEIIGYAEGLYMPYFQMSDVGLSKEENHIIAFNAWKKTNTKAPVDALGLDYYTISFKEEKSYHELLERIKKANIKLIEENNEIFILDPSEIKIKLELVKAQGK